MVGGLIASDPELTLRALAGRAVAREPVWLDAWQRADGAAASAISATLADEVSEPRVVTALAASMPADATLVVSSSMPVRDVETFWPVRDDGPRVLSNRGANGIDGVVSTAFGVAAGLARSGCRATGRRRPGARHRWADRRAAVGARRHPRRAQQRRRRHLRLPAGLDAVGPLRAARGHAHGARARRCRTNLRPDLRDRRGGVWIRRCALARHPEWPELDPRGEDRPSRERGGAPPGVERSAGRRSRPSRNAIRPRRPAAGAPGRNSRSAGARAGAGLELELELELDELDPIPPPVTSLLSSSAPRSSRRSSDRSTPSSWDSSRVSSIPDLPVVVRAGLPRRSPV